MIVEVNIDQLLAFATSLNLGDFLRSRWDKLSWHEANAFTDLAGVSAEQADGRENSKSLWKQPNGMLLFRF